jgi:ABC-type sugar transport system substrate-binding protein
MLGSALILSLVLAACGNSSDSAGKSTGGSGANNDSVVAAAQQRLEPHLSPITSIGDFTPLPSTPPQKSVYVVRNNVPVAALVDAPIKAAAEALGWEVKISAVDPTDPQAQGNAMKQGVAAGADYILVVSGSAESMGAGLDAAKKAGVPVFLEGGTTKAEGEANGIYSNSGSGYIRDAVARLMDEVIVDSNGTGKALVVSVPDYPILATLTDDVKKEFEPACPDCSMQTLDVSIPDLFNAAAPQQIVSALRKNPDIDYLVISFDSLAAGVPEALSTAGLTKVKLLLAAPDATQVPLLAKGTYMMEALQPVETLMWSVFDEMARYSLGVETESEKHDVPPYPVWTKDNVPAGATKFEGPDGYQGQWKALWQVS